MHRLISLLRQQAESIRKLESEADRILHKEQDPDRYRDQLLEKAEILADLPEIFFNSNKVLLGEHNSR